MTGRIVATRIAWSVCGLTLVLLACVVVFGELNRRAGTTTPGDADLWDPYLMAAVVPSAVVGGLISSRRPRNPVGWLIAGHAFCFSFGESSRQYAIYGLLTEPGSLPLARVMASPPYWIWFPGLIILFLLALYFPDGRLLSPRWRPAVWFAVLACVIVTAFTAVLPDDYETPGIPNPLGIEAVRPLLGAGFFNLLAVLWPGFGLLCTASLVARYVRSRGEERQQIKWVAYATVVFVCTGVSETFTRLLFPVSPIAYGGIWAAIALAVLKYRLYDIDRIINRTLVYGTLSVMLIGIYVGAVGYLGTLLRLEDNVAGSLIAAGIVAVLFAPLRDRLQRIVNRLMYGERDDPYAVLSRLGQRLEATVAPEAALSTIVETIGQALKVPYVAIDIKQDAEEFATVAERGTPKGEPVVLPLVYQREKVGRLIVAPRAAGEIFSPADMRLLEDLARQVEVAVHAVRLTEDLQRSRERLVTTREEERRRLRRDLHDGLGPTLGYLTLGLDTARRLFAQDPKGAERLLLELKAKTQEAVSDVRRLVYDLRPPALDDLGLVPAIRQQAANHGLLAEDLNGKGSRWANGNNGLVFKVEAMESLSSLPAAVEVACYRIAQEAIANVSRHAHAKTCRVGLSLDDEQTLELEVVDDGVGMPEDRDAGVGMSSMRERAEELGGTLSVEALPQGGTRVLARLPLSEGRAEE